MKVDTERSRSAKDAAMPAVAGGADLPVPAVLLTCAGPRALLVMEKIAAVIAAGRVAGSAQVPAPAVRRACPTVRR